MRYVAVANEGTGIGICAGAWHGGKTPAAVVENFGVYAATYQLMRGHYTFGIPTLLMNEYRGDAGETEFFGDSGDMTEPLLRAGAHQLPRGPRHRRAQAPRSGTASGG